MNTSIENRIAQLQSSGVQQPLSGRKIGLEKEALRVSPDGNIAQTPHPPALGSALTNASITTDYSEALLELVTPPFEEIRDTLQFLDDTQRFVYSKLDSEVLWATSMPCVVAGDASIPLAQYGSSNAATMKTAYRRGHWPSLWAGNAGHSRRALQLLLPWIDSGSCTSLFWAIVGIASRSVSDCYFGMVRNLQRYGWLVPYLFGASPAICRSFLGGAATDLSELFEHTYYGPFATSLRMGDIGYQNSKEGEAGIKV